MEIECENEKCDVVIEADLNKLECTSNGSSGNYTSSYTYEGLITCPECQTEWVVCIDTDVENDSGEIIDIEFQ